MRVSFHCSLIKSSARSTNTSLYIMLKLAVNFSLLSGQKFSICFPMNLGQLACTFSLLSGQKSSNKYASPLWVIYYYFTQASLLSAKKLLILQKCAYFVSKLYHKYHLDTDLFWRISNFLVLDREAPIIAHCVPCVSYWNLLVTFHCPS